MPRNRIVVILLAFLSAGCTSNPVTPAPFATSTLPEARVMIESLMTPTADYKFGGTQEPTETQSPIATRTIVPTYTPATPAQSSYKLHEWTADQADSMVDQISSYLKAIENDPIYASTYGYENYIAHYKYLASVEMEALLRFPDAAQTENWGWDACYNLALSYTYREDAHAPELDCYAKLIDDGLNTGKTSMNDLPDWFGKHETRFDFEMVSVMPPAGYNSRRIIRLEHSAFLLLLEKDGKFQTTGLMSNMFFFRESSAESLVLDLTGDQFPELILQFHNGSCCGFYSIDYVYDISLPTPKLLTFAKTSGSNSTIGGDENSEITALTGEAIPGLVFKSHDGDWLTQPCDLLLYEKYLWNGQQFELNNRWYTIEQGSSLEKKLCQFAVETTTNQDEINVAVNTIQKMDLRDLSDFRQNILFSLGEYYGGLGNYEKAYGFFSAIVSEQPPSDWSKSAKTLLEHYKKPDDFYLACAAVEHCDMRNALKQTIQRIEPVLFSTIVEILQKRGIQVKDSGIADFDEDGSTEQWVVTQYPDSTDRDFWVLGKDNQKIDALFVAEVSPATPQINWFEVPFGERPLIELKTSTGKILFSLLKMKTSDQPYILRVKPPSNSGDKNEQLTEEEAAKASFWQESVNQAETDIFTNTNPVTVKETLLGLRQSKNHDCEKSACDQLYYLLGLANELSGDQVAAVDTYLQLWQDYPDSIYTIMVRSKLEPTP